MNKGVRISFFIFWNLVIIIFLLEIYLRCFVPIPMFYKISLYNDSGEYTLTENRKLIYVPKPLSGKFNTHGYLGKLYDFEKNHKKRIVFIGDSVTQGCGVDVGRRFSDILNNRSGEFEIINLGVRGYNLLQELEYLKVKGLKYSPDYVMVGITNNDLYTFSGEITMLNEQLKASGESYFYRYYYDAKNNIDNIFLKSCVYRYLKYLLFYMNDISSPNPYQNKNIGYKQISRKQAEDIINQMRKLSQKHDFKLIFVFLPILDYIEDMQPIKNIVSSKKIPCIDLERIVDAEYSDVKKKSLFLPNDHCHLSEKGNKAVADLLDEYIEDLVKNT